MTSSFSDLLRRKRHSLQHVLNTDILGGGGQVFPDSVRTPLTECVRECDAAAVGGSDGGVRSLWGRGRGGSLSDTGEPRVPYAVQERRRDYRRSIHHPHQNLSAPAFFHRHTTSSHLLQVSSSSQTHHLLHLLQVSSFTVTQSL